MFKVFYRFLNSIVHVNQWFVIELQFGPVTTIIMMCTSQSHSHGCEYRSDIQHRPQDDTEVMKDERQDVDEVKRKMPLRSLITNPSQNAR